MVVVFVLLSKEKNQHYALLGIVLIFLYIELIWGKMYDVRCIFFHPRKGKKQNIIISKLHSPEHSEDRYSDILTH